MEESAIYQKLTGIFRDVFDDETLVLRPDMTAEDVEDWDSANHINIVVATEAAFGIKFKSAEIEELKNVGEFVAMIEQKLRR
jgi:acyl carrier protein